MEPSELAIGGILTLFRGWNWWVVKLIRGENHLHWQWSGLLAIFFHYTYSACFKSLPTIREMLHSLYWRVRGLTPDGLQSGPIIHPAISPPHMFLLLSSLFRLRLLGLLPPSRSSAVIGAPDTKLRSINWQSRVATEQQVSMFSRWRKFIHSSWNIFFGRDNVKTYLFNEGIVYSRIHHFGGMLVHKSFLLYHEIRKQYVLQP